MAVIIPYDDEEEAVRIANDTIYGLAAGIWTGDINKAIRMAERIQAGTVYINNYFNSDPVTGRGIQTIRLRTRKRLSGHAHIHADQVGLARHQPSSTGPVSGVTQALQTNAVPANGRIRCYV